MHGITDVAPKPINKLHGKENWSDHKQLTDQSS
jgi:hypothetical protein